MENHPDDLIASVARRMTAGTSSDIRGRVLARLDERTPRQTAFWLSAVSAAVVAMVAVMLFRQPPGGATRSAAATAADFPVATSRQPVAGSPQPAAGRRQPAAGSRQPVARRPQPASPDEAAWQARAVPALPAIDPISLDNIQPAPIDVRPLSIAPLEIPALDDEDN